jgi:predicted RNase H-like HicB family nuclease
MKKVVYPVIISEFNDDGHYFVVTSPNIPGLVTQGESLAEAELRAEDAIATMIEGADFPEVLDPTDWLLSDSDRIVYVSVDMTAWMKNKPKTITVPEYLSDREKEGENSNGFYL